ncbi:Cryptic loci regulator 2 N-terminal domain-containing protein [Madurella fahalii]|uniref:Cryptic loci regulator 2 N-terminal domain-containing protein n=1 Tax=Madurella fahalii TaxID=1157608 RepID=A0ABQ0GMY1_9PEZI
MANAASQNDASADYWPIHIVRSDGQGYDVKDHFALDPNEDQDVAQLERWEVIVAGHLQNQLAPKGDKRQYKLAGFPKGYELRCAVRKDRGRDYFLYGHPAGPKAYYRTPGEFALHALWLVSDSTDNSQCPCDLCPRYLEARARQQPLPAVPQQPAARPPAQSAPPVAASGLAPTTTGPPPGTSGPTNVFRVGELVWYRHTAWRLGVILSIAPKPGNAAAPGASDADYSFTLAPLGHFLLAQGTLVKGSDSMRPFLTFSVPDADMDDLKDKTFEAVDWQSLTYSYSQDPDPSKKAMNLQRIGLEASKMGARAINDCFSTFGLLREGPTPNNDIHTQHYTGVYLGAEMVCVGDPIRVTPTASAGSTTLGVSATVPVPPDATLVMLIDQIVVVTSLLPSGPAAAHSGLQFRGSLYRTVRSPAHAPPGGAVAAENLGPAFAEELATRNAIDTDKAMRWWWVQAAPGLHLRAEQDVQGRFYVTEKLMSIIDPVRYQKWVENGQLEEAPAYLNNRNQSGAGHFYGRRPCRAATLGQAVSVKFMAPAGMVEN